MKFVLPTLARQLTLISSVLILGCNATYIDYQSISSDMNKQIGQQFKGHNMTKLVKRNDQISEYETGLGNGCTWVIIVNNHTNIIEGWRITSDLKPCEEGVVSYG